MSKKNKQQEKRIFSNEHIRAKEVRLINENGEQLGIKSLEEALKIAKEKGLDLIQVTEKANPPVCRIGDLGKFLYHLKKKESKKHSAGELKGIRISFNISDHDMETKSKQAEKFLKKGDKIMIEMVLKGREKALKSFAEEKINKFLSILENLIPIKIERELKAQPRGLTIIISKK